MTTASLGGTRPAFSPRTSNGFGIRRLVAHFAHEWSIRRARIAMEKLDDAVLHDIGIDRGQIDEAVRYGLPPH